MSDPKFPLGVALMDDDHAELEALFETAPGVADDALLPFLARCREAIAAHFAREEELMTARAVPVLHCPVAQHRPLVEAIDAVIAQQGAAANTPALRAFCERDVPNLVMGHVASVDQVTAQFLKGGLDPRMVEALRLPVGSGS